MNLGEFSGSVLSLAQFSEPNYDDFNSQIFDLIDEIEQQQILDKILTIPNIVAAGDQTSGKSSVLGKLSGVPLPTGDSTVTLCATQLALRKSPKKSCKMISPEVKEIAEIDGIGDEIKEIQRKLMPHGGFIFDVMPRIRIENSQAKNLTVIDLPGLIHAASKHQEDTVVDAVYNMVLKYISNPNSIILCVIDVTRDLALNKIFQLVKDKDPEGRRTIVVFTKIDKCLSDKPRLESFLDQVRKRDYHPFKHFVFVNSKMDSEEQEQVFFESAVCQEFGIPLENCTYKNLYKKVCCMLLKPVLSEFKNSWVKVDEFRNRLIEERNTLPVYNPNTRQLVDLKLSEFIEACRENLKGKFSSRSSGRELFSEYRFCFETFKDEYKSAMDELVERQNINDVVDKWRRLEMANFHNWDNFKCFAVPIITSFRNPATICHNSIRNLNKEVVVELIWEMFDGQEQHINFLLEKVNDIFKEQDDILTERLRRIYESERYFYTDDELYERLLQKRLLDENSPEIQRSWKILKTFIRKNPAVAAAMGAGHDAVNNLEDVEEVEEAEYTEEELGKVLANMGKIFEAARGEQHVGRKRVTYETALGILMDMAMDRISNTIPATILVCLNDEVQEKIQKIDRYYEEFQSITWAKTRAEERREFLDQQEESIRRWRMQFLRIEKQMRDSVGT